MLQGVLQSQFGPNSGGTISYIGWLTIAGPLCLLLLLILWLVLVLCFMRYEALKEAISFVLSYCRYSTTSSSSNTSATSDSTSSSPLKSGVRSIMDTSALFAYTSRHTPKSGYTKQINKEDWDIENTIDARESTLEMAQVKPLQAQRLELSPMASPDVAESDDFLYSGSINFKTSLDAAEDTDVNKGRGIGSEYSSAVRRKQRAHTRSAMVSTSPRYSMRSTRHRSHSSSLLQEADDEEEEEEDLDLAAGLDDTHTGDKAASLEEEFTTINFTAQVPSSTSKRDATVSKTTRGVSGK